MQILNGKVYTIGACFLFGITYISCNKDPGNGSGREIISINPTHGSFSSLDTILGKGFGTIAANDSVFINGHKANIISISNTQLVVSVPKLAGTGTVSVWVDGNPINGPVFTYDTTYTAITY